MDYRVNTDCLPSGDGGDEMSVSPPRHQWGRAALGLARQDHFCPHLRGHLDCVVVAAHAHYLRHSWIGGEVAAVMLNHLQS